MPFSADTMLGTLTARVESDVPIPDVPEKLAAVLKTMTERDPEARPSSNTAGVALVRSAEGMPRPSSLPLAGMPVAPPATVIVPPTDDPDITVIDQPDQTEVAGTPIVSREELLIDTDTDEPSRRWPWLLFSLVAVAAIGWFAYGALQTSAVLAPPVPDVAGFEIDDAIAEFGDTWVLDENFDRDPDVEPGLIIRTEPVASELLAEGETLSYWVSLGRPLVRVPVGDLVGRSQQQAEATLEAEGLIVGQVEQVNSEDVGAGNVISVDSSTPELEQGQPVDLVVSLGPLQRQIPTFDAATNVDEYILRLEEAGLGVNRLDEFNDETPEGQFVSVDPPPGTSIDRGASVNVVVSMGPVPVAVPSSSGQGLGDVLNALENLGLLAGELQGPGGAEPNAGCPVVGTDPPAGTQLQPGNPVTILLSDC